MKDDAWKAVLGSAILAVLSFSSTLASAPQSAVTLREALMPIRARTLSARLLPGSEWFFSPFPDVGLELVVDDVRAGVIADTVVRAHVRGEPGSWARFVFHGSVVVGDVMSPAQGTFEIRWTPAGQHMVRQVDRSVGTICATVLPQVTVAPALGPFSAAGSVSVGPGNTVIDVMVVYTPSAAAMAGGVPAIEATIESYVDYANQVYADSGATQELALVHAAQLAYIESGNSITDLVRLKTPGDGFMDDVHALRDAFAADCVVLIATSGSAGVGYLMDNVSSSFASCAFSTIGHDVGGLPFVHELGHNMGCGHNNGFGPAAFCFSYGHRTPDNLWRTVMSNSPGTHVDFFSSPHLSFGSHPLGIDGAGCPPDAADNVTSLNLTAPVVAAFR